ncbi:MAG: hypothetical protein HYZ39_10250 [Mycolicibacterium cosmeticum]|nr:hypothetical protein [Mycolicibacterium cosmeticum]
MSLKPLNPPRHDSSASGNDLGARAPADQFALPYSPGEVTQPHAAPTLNVDEQMVTFAYRWMPFGGSADEEVFTSFGLTPVQFYMRVREILLKCDVPEEFRPIHYGFLSYCDQRVRDYTRKR